MNSAVQLGHKRPILPKTKHDSTVELKSEHAAPHDSIYDTHPFSRVVLTPHMRSKSGSSSNVTLETDSQLAALKLRWFTCANTGKQTNMLMRLRSCALPPQPLVINFLSSIEGYRVFLFRRQTTPHLLLTAYSHVQHIDDN